MNVMDKYIKIEDVAKIIEELQFTISMCLSEDECLGMRRAQDIIARYVRIALPAADVVDVRHGRWITRHKWDYFVCSCCSHETNNATNYCPNCGAKMNGEQDDA